MDAGRLLLAAGRTVLDAVLPPRCLTCDAGVGAPGQLCADCFKRTAFVTEPCCRRCGQPFATAGQGGPARVCDECLAHPPPWRQARAALRYDEQARRILLPFKHADRVDLARAVAAHMVRAGSALLADAEVLVPVPLHRWRLLARRYNQSALLCHAITRRTGVPSVPDALVRHHATVPLGRLTRPQREQAVAGAFRVGRPGAVAGRRVLLVDDVLTTGATAAGCASCLLAAGAARVDLLVAARVPDTHAAFRGDSGDDDE